jgi:hypothetical protein
LIEAKNISVVFIKGIAVCLLYKIHFTSIISITIF